MEDKKDLELTVGSKYTITSLGSRDAPITSSGTFTGYVSVGDGSAICIELDKSHRDLSGKTRIIPTHMILAIDVVKRAKRAEEKEKTETTSRSYL